MSQRRILQSPAAARDLDAILDFYLAEAGAPTAGRFLDSLEHTLQLLMATPEMGIRCSFQSEHLQQLRRIPLHLPFGSWLLFYTPSPAQVRIERILHGARDWGVLFD